jgi:hypothetical protein
MPIKLRSRSPVWSPVDIKAFLDIRRRLMGGGIVQATAERQARAAVDVMRPCSARHETVHLPARVDPPAPKRGSVIRAFCIDEPGAWDRGLRFALIGPRG